MFLSLLCSSAVAAEGNFEMGVGMGFGPGATPAIAESRDGTAFAFLPGRHFGVRVGGGALVSDRIEVGGGLNVDFASYQLLYSDRGPSLGQGAAYQLAPHIRVHQPLTQALGVYGGVHPGVVMYSNLTKGQDADSSPWESTTFVPAATGTAGVRVQGFSEYAFFAEGAATWQARFPTDDELALFQTVADMAPDQAADLEDPSNLKWRVTVGVWVYGRR